MSYPVRQGATHTICVGPAVALDGLALVTTLDISTADDAVARLYNNNTVVDIAAYTWAAVTNMAGYYSLTLQTGISNTLGDVTISIRDDSLILPLKHCYYVESPTYYDLRQKDITAFLRAIDSIGYGTVGTGSTLTNIVTSSITPALTVADQVKGRIITFYNATTTGALKIQSSDITASTSGGEMTVTALTTAPVSGDLFTIQ